MTLTHGFLTLLPFPPAQVAEAMRSFEGALGFQCRSRTANEIHLSRHAFLCDRFEIAIGPHPERADETAISGSLRLHPLRHPFARRRPSPDSFGMNRAITAHLHPLLRGPAG